MGMYLKRYYHLLIPAALCASCQPPENQDHLATSRVNASENAGSKGKLQRLAGTWVGQRKDGFDLVKIKLDCTGTYTHFDDRQQVYKSIHKTLPDSLRYFLYESPMRVTFDPNAPYQPKVAIHTSHFRFDYDLVADTLIEIDKMGVQGKLIRVRLNH